MEFSVFKIRRILEFLVKNTIKFSIFFICKRNFLNKILESICVGSQLTINWIQSNFCFINEILTNDNSRKKLPSLICLKLPKERISNLLDKNQSTLLVIKIFDWPILFQN
ncbi:hypothetical protein DERP_008116 [Dermatophagoides pteronyssinus]|uniref:Uncharacterized protein n=1 Tax=Dermatophagoides pteronyssinus TaxID=6956 RepID=A0ABQ8JK85_DERPT|nr:hypothetical protein DERP_008116 [Dermatophagoides pteronyssinus]